MRFEHEGLCLWYGEPDTPAPGEVVAARTEITLTLGVQPADPNNRVGVLYRTNRGPTETVPARLLWSDSSGRTQHYRAHLPAFRTGDTVEYVPIFYRAGRQVPAPEDVPQSVSSFRVTGTGDDATPGFAPEEVSPLGETSMRRLLSVTTKDYAFAPGTGKNTYAKEMRALLDTRPNTELILYSDPRRRRIISDIASFIKHLVTNPRITKPVGDLWIASHGTDQGYMEISPVPGAKSSITTYDVLDELARNPSANPLLIPDVLRQQGDGTTVHIRGCRIGQSKPFMEKLKEVFGTEIKVTAPKHFHLVDGKLGPPGWAEYLAYGFTINTPEPLPDKTAVVATFEDRQEFIPEFKFIDGTPVPNTVWPKWIPDDVNRGEELKIPVPVKLGTKIRKKSVAKVNGRYIHRTADYPYPYPVGPLPADPGDGAPNREAKKQRRLDALLDALSKDDEFKASHPYPKYKQFGYDGLLAFYNGYSWDCKWKKPKLLCTGERHEYFVVIPITNPVTGDLIFNYFPSRHSGDKPFLSLVESDSRMFESV